MAIVLDTGPLLAGLDANDRDHRRCQLLIEQATEPRLIPSPVLPEVDYFAHQRLGPRAFITLLDDIATGAFEVVDLVPPDYGRIRELLARYEDLDLGFVDAAVIAVAERLGEPKVATLDHRHFRTVRPRHVAAFQLLPG